MIRYLIVCLLLGLSTLSVAQKNKISVFELDQIRGLFYQRNTIGPFTGTAIEDHSNGKKKLQIPIKDGKFHGTIREWAKDGTKISEMEYKEGKKHGKETQWYATGKKSVEVNYINGEPDGTYTEWHKNGQKKSEGQFRMGKEEGQHTWWFATGQVDQEAFYKNGQTEGIVKNWYLNGQLKMESNYRVGKQDGLTKKWYENGQQKSVETFKNGEPDGESSFWDDEGFLHTIRIHENGKLVQEKIYRSGSINVGNGYVQVYNEGKSYFKVPVLGDRVRPVDVKNITYVLDGFVVQLFNVPSGRFVDTINEPEKSRSVLQAYLDYEGKVLQEREPNFSFDVKQEKVTTEQGLEAVYWNFESPSKFAEDQTSRTIQEEHYFSVLCGEQVLSIYSAVTKSDDPIEVKKILNRIADGVEVKNEPIDLNTIISDLRN